MNVINYKGKQYNIPDKFVNTENFSCGCVLVFNKEGTEAYSLKVCDDCKMQDMNEEKEGTTLEYDDDRDDLIKGVERIVKVEVLKNET